jgi:glycosyltransferase involved in cell wall biosynthesis
MTYKFSIITVNYNNKQGLQKTIDSVIGQTFRDFEFIIVDGESTDGGKEVITENASHFTSFLSETDNGIYHAMNKGIRMATGEYLLFLNSGDSLIDNEVLAKLNNEIDGAADLYYGDILFEESTRTKKIFSPDKLTFDFFFTDNLPHQASFIKRSLFEQLFYYNEEFKIVSDWEFLIYAVCKANISYKHLNILVALYDGNGISSNSDNYKMMYAERDAVINRHFPAFKDDYAKISLLKQRRVKQFLFIREHSFAWEILKILMKTILLFIPKKEPKK